MYKVVEVDTNATYGVNAQVLVALADEHGGKALITKDDHCLVLKIDVGSGIFTTTAHWFREAIEAIPQEW